jgi:hypothetical protein
VVALVLFAPAVVVTPGRGQPRAIQVRRPSPRATGMQMPMRTLGVRETSKYVAVT